MTTTTPEAPTREPARILEPGTFPLPGFPGTFLTYGHDAVLDAVPEICAQPSLAVDIETAGLKLLARQIKCVQVGTSTHAWLFDPRDPAQHAALVRIFNTAPELVIHNSAFDAPALAFNNLITAAHAAKVTDTILWARLADPSERGDRSLVNCVRLYLGLDVEDGVAARARKLGMTKDQYFLRVDLNSPAYRWDAASDAIVTARLRTLLERRAYDHLTTGHPFEIYGVKGEEAWRLVWREQRINRMTLARTIKGLRWDPEYLDAYRDAKAKDLAAQEAELGNRGIRPGNSDDLVAYLEKTGELPADWPRTPTGKLAADKKNVEKLAEHVPLVASFLANKHALHIDKDYLSKAATLAWEDGRIHPAVKILGAAETGRMAISEPPLQQFEDKARGIIIPDEGDSFTSIDWSQIEPVTAANIAGDHVVLDRYENLSLSKEEGDAYLGIAAMAGISRKEAKVVLLAAMYNQGYLSLGQNLGVITPAEAAAVRQLCTQLNPATTQGGTDSWGRPVKPRNYWQREAAEILGVSGYFQAAKVQRAVFDAMPGTEALIKRLKEKVAPCGKIFTVSGRILPLDKETKSTWGRGEYSSHKILNKMIQGSAYDILAEALISIIDAGLSDAVYLAMHDELVVSTDAAHDVQRIMATPPERLCWMAGRTPVLRTDLEVLGERWKKC